VLFAVLFEFEAGAEADTVFVFEACTVGGGGVGRVCVTTGAGADCAGTSFDALTTLGACGASLADTVDADEERLGAGALHVLGVGAGCDPRATCSERSEDGGAVAA
jgi:hypothetical protein